MTKLGREDMKGKSPAGQYRAKTLASAAGISTTLLRAWERRYDIFEPERRPGGHRLYTEDDLSVLRRLRELTASGLAIGEAVALGRKVLLEPRQPRPERAKPLGPLREPLPDQVSLVSQLAPLDLKIHRATRFSGEDLGVSIGQLHPSDLSVLYRLYKTLKSVYEIWIYLEQRLVRSILVGRFKSLFVPGRASEIKALGAATDPKDWRLGEALKDARSGALEAMFDFCAQRDLDELNTTELHVLLTLARDHAKMMRNSFYDLDELVREADESPKAHSLAPMLRKLQTLYEGRMTFRTGTSYTGAISSRCLETSALDRVLYRFLDLCVDPAGKEAGLWVTQINSQLCRWAFECSVDKFRLPEPGDLTVEATAMAMGVRPEDILSHAYIGSARRAGRLWAWFHWPIYDPPAEVPHCLCEPLSEN